MGPSFALERKAAVELLKRSGVRLGGRTRRAREDAFAAPREGYELTASPSYCVGLKARSPRNRGGARRGVALLGKSSPTVGTSFLDRPPQHARPRAGDGGQGRPIRQLQLYINRRRLRARGVVFARALSARPTQMMRARFDSLRQRRSRSVFAIALESAPVDCADIMPLLMTIAACLRCRAPLA